MKKARDLAAQLSNTEWLASFPGTDEQKASVRGCAHCHTFELVTRSRHDADEFMGVNDRILRLDPKTDQMIEYLLPRKTNVRRVWVDNRTTPVTFWVGNNHGASIVKVQPLDSLD